ncbi:hypothetical protein JCM14036_13360 [Desulfotomaculum defluvii]
MKRTFIVVLMAAVLMFSFSSAALAGNAPEVHKTYYFDYVDYDYYYHNHRHHQVDFVDYQLLIRYFEDRNVYVFDYEDFLEWLEQLKEKNHSFGTVHLQGYKNGVAQYK